MRPYGSSMEKTTNTANALAVQLEEAWRRFRDAVSDVEDRLDEPTPAGWKAKEMLGHMGFWQEAMEGVIVGMFRGEQLPGGWTFGSGYDPSTDHEWPRAMVHNAREAAWARDRSTREVLDRLDRSHDRALEILNGLSREELADERYKSYVAEKCGHYDEHRAELEAIATA